MALLRCAGFELALVPSIACAAFFASTAHSRASVSLTSCARSFSAAAFCAARRVAEWCTIVDAELAQLSSGGVARKEGDASE